MMRIGMPRIISIEARRIGISVAIMTVAAQEEQKKEGIGRWRGTQIPHH